MSCLGRDRLKNRAGKTNLQMSWLNNRADKLRSGSKSDQTRSINFHHKGRFWDEKLFLMMNYQWFKHPKKEETNKFVSESNGIKVIPE